MAKFSSVMFSYGFLIVFILRLNLHFGASDESRKVYIVYMGALPEGEYSPSSHHFRMLQENVEASFVEQSLIRSYTRSFNAFAANITEEEGRKLANIEGVVSVFPSRTLQPQTTRSWDFMGFCENIHRNPAVEGDVVVGIFDTGIWPELESFGDEGFSPAPNKWKGACKGGPNFTCNNKIIGARYYNIQNITGENSARDTIGHGTHTASTAAGNHVKNASFYGLAGGIARGGVPSARIAAYKVCHPDKGCEDEEVLAAFDDAIADGVDLISISIGGDFAAELISDSLAIGAFHAMERGILTVNSAGNNGDQAGTVASVAPWMLTVAASSMDRRIIDKVVLGNGATIVGTAVNSFELKGSEFPMIYGRETTSECDPDSARLCDTGCLDSSLVKGKILVCDSVLGLKQANKVGALGLIATAESENDFSLPVPLPASVLSEHETELIHSYINSTKLPQATITRSEVLRDHAAPVVASFSSRGPNSVIPDILKPDVTAPGVEILAAYSPAASLTDNHFDKRSTKFNIMCGTSMSCPHAAGAAAYLKSLHPDWSPSAIKSALMTSAWPMNATKNRDGEFAYGAGHINPVKAAHPGLVYETTKYDYLKMLCDMGYSTRRLRGVFGGNSRCPEGSKKSPRELNYPTMAAQVKSGRPYTIKFPRTVTNVGLANSTYTAEITSNSRINVKVDPSVLSFKSLNEKESFVVTVNGDGQEAMASASLAWSDGEHNVRSPIVVYTDSYSMN